MLITRRMFLRMAALLPFAHWDGTMEPSPKIRIMNYQTKAVEVLPLEVYLRYVLPAEMPAEWPADALRAQAIACRSFAWYACSHPRHSVAGADVCDSPRHCQLFRRGGGSHSLTDKALADTRGLICTYQGKVAQTFYHAACGGRTTDSFSARRNGSHFILQPYLQSVRCPCGTTQRQGHGIGMCQAGARRLAEDGKSYVQILQWYYPGINIEPMEA